MINVLLIDDEPWILAGLQRIFNWEQYGFHVEAAVCDPLEGLSILQQRNIDVVFSDIRMPGMSGLELLKEAKALNPSIIFIIISGYSHFEYAQEALRHGAYDYLLKPLDTSQTEELLARLSKNFRQFSITDSSSFDNSLFEQMKEYISEHYSEDLYLKDLAEHFYLNFTYCSELFKKNAGITFSKYLTDLRMEKAADLLLHSSKTIEEIAFHCGYNDYSYFNKVFKRYYDIPPSQYRCDQKGVL